VTWDEFCDLVDWMAVRWPDMSRWSDRRLDALWEDLAAWPAGGVRQAVRLIYEDGGRLPTGGQIIKTCRALGHQPAADNAEHRHVWGIVEWENDRPDRLRLLVCATCHTEKTIDPAKELV